MIARPIQL